MALTFVTRQISSKVVGLVSALLLLVVLSTVASAAQISDVRVKGLADRDLVIITSDQESLQPDMVVQKLLPTRLEVLFNGLAAPEIDLTAAKNGLVNRVSLMQGDNQVTLVIQLDHQGKANPEMFRWSNPRPNLCVLEVFHPTSDRSGLTDALLGLEPPVAAPSAPDVAATTPAVESAPVPEAAPAPAVTAPAKVLESVSFDRDQGVVSVALSEGIDPEVKRGNFPPSISIEFADAMLGTGVPTFVAKYYERILHVTTREMMRADGSPEASEILIVFTDGPEVGYSVERSPDGKSVLVKLTGYENPKPEPAVETPVAPAAPEPVVETPQPTVEVPPAQPVAEAVPPVETVAPEPEAAVVAPAATGFVTGVNYDSATGTLTVVTDLNSVVTAKRETFPPGYTITVDKPLAEGIQSTITKFLKGVYWISASNFTANDSAAARLRVQFENGVNWTLLSSNDSADGCTHTFVFGAAAAAAAPEPVVETPVAPAATPEPAAEAVPAETPAAPLASEDTSGDVSAPSVDELAGNGGGTTTEKDNETTKQSNYDDFPQYDMEQFQGREGEYALPEFAGMKDKLSDVLVTLPRGISIFSALELMSAVSGISIILDPYWNQNPRGTGITNRPPLDTLGPGQGLGGSGFRGADQFNAITFQPGYAIQGNFTNVPFDIALKILLDGNSLKMKVYRDDSDPYAKPIVFVTSRERMEHELNDANEVELYQLHYADPNQIVQILWNMNILPSLNVGYYTYRGSTTNNQGGGGTGTGRGGSGGSGGSGGGGGGFRGQDVPGVTATAPGYFGEPMQGLSPGGGGGAGGTGGGTNQGGGGTNQGGGQQQQGGGIALPTAKSGLIIMRGTRDTLEMAKDIIRKIDKPPKQASLKVTIYTVTENPQTVYGLLTGQANRDRSFWDYGGGSLGLTIPPKGGIIPSDNYTLAFNALQTERKAKVINQTEVAVIDGVQANINFNRTRGNFRTTVTFDANGNAFRTGTFDEVTADTSLVFIPQIDDYGRITLQFNPDVTVFDGPPQVAQDGQGGEVTFQPTTTTTLSTILRLQDGETALIGGLMIETDSDDIEKVPLLGDLPFIGSIFSHHNKSRETSYIFVTITATIIDDK